MLRSTDFLLTVRLWFYGLATLHLIFLALVVLPIDMSKDEDPRVSVYIRVRWKLITCWFNFMSLAYFPICFYCDWREKHGQWNESRVEQLRKLRDNMMTSILFPVTMYSDVFFWLLWMKDPSLIAPVAVFTYLPGWAQHSLHTASALIVLLDLLLLPRRRPYNVLPGLCWMVAFVALYSTVTTISYFQGETVYSFLDTFNILEVVLFGVFTMCLLLFFNTLQWHIIDFRWGRYNIKIVSNGCHNNKYS